MTLSRRAVMASAMLAPLAARAAAADAPEKYGLIGQLKAKPGQRDALIAILLEDSDAMPGCLAYIVAKDSADADAIWVTELWDSKASHAASLKLPVVRAAIARGRPLVAGFGTSAQTVPVGGKGL